MQIDGSKLKEIRIRKGLTQKQLGDLCGIADSNLRKYESNKQNPKIETVRKIASALGIGIEVLEGLETFDSGEEFTKRWNQLVNCSNDKEMIDKAFDSMNEKGQRKLAEYAEDLTKIPEYKKDFQEKPE